MHKKISFSIRLLILSLATAGLLHGSTPSPGDRDQAVREQTRKYISYYESIELTNDQQVVMHMALSRLPAACCKNYSAATCCCECNLSRTVWGLSKHLIANLGQSAQQVRTAVIEWIKTVNPDGFSGRSCFTGGCGRPFAADGCGGMSATDIRF